MAMGLRVTPAERLAGMAEGMVKVVAVAVRVAAAAAAAAVAAEVVAGIAQAREPVWVQAVTSRKTCWRYVGDEGVEVVSHAKGRVGSFTSSAGISWSRVACLARSS